MSAGLPSNAMASVRSIPSNWKPSRGPAVMLSAFPANFNARDGDLDSAASVVLDVEEC
jgi:hypothetical protein